MVDILWSLLGGQGIQGGIQILRNYMRFGLTLLVPPQYLCHYPGHYLLPPLSSLNLPYTATLARSSSVSQYFFSNCYSIFQNPSTSLLIS